MRTMIGMLIQMFISKHIVFKKFESFTDDKSFFPFKSVFSLNILVIYDFTLVIKSFLFFIFVFLCINSLMTYRFLFSLSLSFFLYFYDVLLLLLMMTTIARLFLFELFYLCCERACAIALLSFGDICCGF
jgi:hypothetical protein